MDRIESWFADPDSRPMMLVSGAPGAGKSSVLLQFLEATAPEQVVASILRAPTYREPFDGIQFLDEVVKGLVRGGVKVEEPKPSSVPAEVSIDINTGDVHGGEVLGGVFNFESSGDLPLAERLIRAVPADRRFLIVIDALDEAEDTDFENFIGAVSSLVRAAETSGVRILCASRRTVPVRIEPSLVSSFDLVDDAPEDDPDLRDYLQERFAELEEEDRKRVVATLVAGAENNWLWATTNADSLEEEIRELDHVPAQLLFTAGLDGLYGDGVTRMRRRLGEHWEPEGRMLLTVLSCAFDEHLSLIELRWVLGREGSEIEDAVAGCEPFLRRTPNGVRVFHPDFARWVLAGNIPGVSEQEGHLAVAKGLTEFGRKMGWSDSTVNSAPRVLNHWCMVLVLDPFSPSFRDHETEVSSIIGDVDWAARAGTSLDMLEQVALVAPALRFPGSELPFGVAYSTLTRSEASKSLVGQRISSMLPEAEIEALDPDASPAKTLEWLDERLPNYKSEALQILWGAVLSGHFVFTESDGELNAELNEKAILEALPGKEFGDLPRIRSLMDDLHPAAPSGLIAELEDGLAEMELTQERALRCAVLAEAYLERARQRATETEDLASDEEARLACLEDLRSSIAALRGVLESELSDDADRIFCLVGIANALRRALDLAPSADDAEERIEVLEELVELMPDSDDRWPLVSEQLGIAYQDRATSEDEEPPDSDELRRAGAVFRESLATREETDPRRIRTLMRLADTLVQLDRTKDEKDELVEVNRWILHLRRQIGDPGWVFAAGLLGRAALDRLDPDGPTEEQQANINLALAAFREALSGTARVGQARVEPLIDLANILMNLKHQTDDQLKELISVQAELVETTGKGEDPRRPEIANFLGDSLLKRAQRNHGGAFINEVDLRKAVNAYRTAVDETDEKDDVYIGYVHDLEHALRGLERAVASELDELIDIQEKLREHYADDVPSRAHITNLLGDSYRKRASYQADDEMRAGDLTLALARYREAYEQVEDPAQRPIFAIDLANTLVMHSAVTRTGGPVILREAVSLVAAAIAEPSDGDDDDGGALRSGLLPILASAVRRLH